MQLYMESRVSWKQSVVGSNPTRVALFSFYVKKKVLGLVAKRFFHVQHASEQMLCICKIMCLAH